MKKILAILFPISDFLYLLQLQEYETQRYFKTIKRLFFMRNLQKRGKLVFTKRIKITLGLALPICIIVPPLTPLWIGVSNVILTPYFERIKANIQKKASIYFKNSNRQTKVVAVAGSYGKTTTKNYIYELVKYNYKTQMVPGNINTPTGIANWVLSSFDPTSNLLIIEVDTYFIGEIRKSLSITPPDIAILTNIGDQHLERFGNKAKLKEALLEIFNYAKKDAIKIKDKDSNLAYALEVAKILKIPKDIIKDTVSKLKKPDRRGDIKVINTYEVIDDSYNISETTAKAGISNALKVAHAKGKKLIVITAGIPELGEENKNANINLGLLLSKKADKVILIKSILYKDVLGDSDKFYIVENLAKAWELLGQYSPKEYLVLLQPELNDLYY